MMLPNRISSGRDRPAVALLLVGCLVSFTLGQQLGSALRYPELHASTIPTAHAAGQLSGQLSAPSSRLAVRSGPSGQQAPPIVTTPSHAHSTARAPAPAMKHSAASHGKKDTESKKDKHDGRQGNPAARHGGHAKHQKGDDGHGHGHSSKT